MTYYVSSRMLNPTHSLYALCSQNELECNVLPLFELGSVQHAQYLLNIRLPNSSRVGPEMRNDLRKLKEMIVHVSMWMKDSS